MQSTFYHLLMVELSASIVDAIHRTFFPSDWSKVSDLLRRETADNLPFMDDIHEPAGFDRLRMAALKFSDGDLDKLQNAVALGKEDWRDLLMAAGLGQPSTHLEWYEAIRAKPEKV